MITVLVKFKISNELLFHSKRKVYRELLRYYIGLDTDIEKGYAGGVYTFTKIEFAKKWFDEERIKWITERYSKPEITYYESPVIVDNEKNKIIS